MGGVYGRIRGQEDAPGFVLPVGDVVESGLPGEYEEYARVEPGALAGPVRAVPGNHEVRWDEEALETYFERFGRTPYSSDAGGFRVVALDPTGTDDLRGTHREVPLRFSRSSTGVCAKNAILDCPRSGSR